MKQSPDPCSRARADLFLAAAAQSFPQPLPAMRHHAPKSGTAHGSASPRNTHGPEQAAPGLPAEPLPYPSWELLLPRGFKHNRGRQETWYNHRYNHISGAEPCKGTLPSPQRRVTNIPVSPGATTPRIFGLLPVPGPAGPGLPTGCGFPRPPANPPPPPRRCGRARGRTKRRQDAAAS